MYGIHSFINYLKLCCVLLPDLYKVHGLSSPELKRNEYYTGFVTIHFYSRQSIIYKNICDDFLIIYAIFPSLTVFVYTVNIKYV